MEAAAAIIGVTEVAIRTSSKLWSLCNAWRDAPGDLHRLRDDLTRTEQFFGEVREGLQLSSPVVEKAIHKDALPRPSTDLDRLLETGTAIVRQIESIIDALRGRDGFAEGTEGLRKRRRLIWLKDAPRVAKLRKELAGTVSAICRVLVARNVLMSNEIRTSIERHQDDIVSKIAIHTERKLQAIVDSSEARILSRVDERLNVLQVQMTTAITQDLTSPTPLTPFPGQTWGSHPIRSAPCGIQACQCRCHHGTNLNLWNISAFHSFLGSAKVIYSSTSGRQCTETACRDSRRRYSPSELRVLYHFPPWLARVAICFFFHNNVGGSPQLNIRVHTRISPDGVSRRQSLYGIIDRGDETHAILEALWEGRASVHDVTTDFDVSPLWWALIVRRVETVKVLIQAGADPYQITLNRSPARKAMEMLLAGDPMGKQLSDVFPVSKYIEDHDYPILHRVLVGDLFIDFSDALNGLDPASDLDAPASDGTTPLELAGIKGDARAVRLLLRAGVDPNSKSAAMCLEHAVRYGHADTVEALLRAGVPIKPALHGETLPHLAARCLGGDPRVLDLLLQYGATPEFEDSLGQRSHSLNVAAGVGNLRVIRYLLDHGTDINVGDWEGDTALHDAVLQGQPGSARLLLELGADPASTNQYGRGTLHHLAAAGSLDMIGVFMDVDGGLRGMSTLAKDHQGKTPLQIFNERPTEPELREAFVRLLDRVDEEDAEVFFDAQEVAAEKSFV